MTYNYSKTFFSKKRAESFQAELNAQGINADILDGCGLFESRRDPVLCEMEPRMIRK